MNNTKNALIQKDSAAIEKLAAKELQNGVTMLSSILPNIIPLISPVFNVAYERQMNMGDINLKYVSTAASGLWHSKVCINATTILLQTEHDYSYTLITVPMEDTIKICTENPKYVFIFKLNSKMNIGLSMSSNMSFISSGKLLTHRQHCIKHDNKDIPFYNMDSYGNKILFTHIMKSFERSTNQYFPPILERV